MRTGTFRPRTSLVLVVGLVVLAGVCPDTSPVLAQTAQSCPLQPGVTPLSPPAVTAQQAANDPALLDDFALAVRAQYHESSLTTPGALYLGCRIREEGDHWRSGSTYLVTLTDDSRVFVHAKDMSLSGFKLHPTIYRAILQALGIDAADRAAFRAAFATAIAGHGGRFEAPESPGASGYAAAYFATHLGRPIVRLAGFDLVQAHLVPVSEDDIDYGAPAITAREVVDRDTLKAFVTEAGKYVLALQASGDPARPSKIRIAFRDPNGPWRHGPVYLYMLVLSSNTIAFHGAFPDRYELCPLMATVRDVVTGELIREGRSEGVRRTAVEGNVGEDTLDIRLQPCVGDPMPHCHHAHAGDSGPSGRLGACPQPGPTKSPAWGCSSS